MILSMSGTWHKTRMALPLRVTIFLDSLLESVCSVSRTKSGGARKKEKREVVLSGKKGQILQGKGETKRVSELAKLCITQDILK